MSDADAEKASSDRQAAEPLAELSGVADDIKGLLSKLSGEIDETQKLQRQALAQIEARLTAIETTRAQPAQDQAVIKAREAAHTAAPRSKAEPWDLDAAEALTQAYETEDPAYVQEPACPEPHPAYARLERNPQRPSEPKPRRPMSDDERAWLGARVSEFTQRLKRSLAEMHPKTSIVALEGRLAQFHQRIAVALDDVVRRSDLDGLKRIEAHIGDLSARLGAVQTQLVRLDGVEAQLRQVVDRLSDGQLAHMLARHGNANLEIVARMAAEETQARASAGADRAADAHAARLDELRAVIEASMHERRAGEQQAVTILDTLQQALVQVLDRIESIEQGRHAERSHPAPARAPYSETPHAAADHGPRVAMEEQHRTGEPGGELPAAPYAAVAPPAPPGQPQASQLVATEMQLEEPLESVVDRMRRDFIADAQRAKLKAAASRAEQAARRSAAARQAHGPSRMSAWAASALAMSPGRLLGGSPKLLVSALVLAVLINAGLVVRLWHQQEVRGAQSAAAVPGPSAGVTHASPSIEASSPIDTAGAHQESVPSSGVETTAPDPIIGGPAVGPEAEAMERETLSQGAAGPNEQFTDEGAPADETRTTDDLPGRLGAVAAKANMASLFAEESADPAALAGLQHAGTGKARTSALDLPPATVGPLSLRLAAANGDASAQFEVAARLAEGKGTDQNLEEAVRWYQRSAAQGFAQAQYRLGTHLERGLGTTKDIARARVWYQRAAEKGNVKAMHNLAVLNAGPETGAPDYTAARKLFTDAADRGLADSQYNLAVLYENGLGVTQNRALAYKWYSLAAKGGDKDAAARRDTIKPELAASELTSAEEMVRKFTPKPIEALVNDARAAGEDWKKREISEVNG